MIRALTTINGVMNSMGIPYSFDDWNNESELPQFVGEISEVPTTEEDGCNEYSFTLTGFATSYDYLLSVAKQIRSTFKISAIVDGVVIKYNNTVPISSDTDDLKQIQINLTIKDWSV